MKIKKFLREQIHDACDRVAAEINRHYAFISQQNLEPLRIIGILKGGLPFFLDITRRLKVPVVWDFVEVSSYGKQMESSMEVKFLKKPSECVNEKHVLLLDDVMDSGLTHYFLLDWMRQHGAASVKVGVCVDKKARRQWDVTPDFTGFLMEDEGFLFGYGMDLEGKCRELYDIWSVNL
ncbi:MAG: phosphoribosyltransferase family protein [Planctomycetia bacterium]|nr:phosphoribosyltransferase family protein [Planctomycetia bacterium]